MSSPAASSVSASRPEQFHATREALLAADRELTAPGAPFEIVEEDVLGERLQVFRERPHSLREILGQAAAHGSGDVYIFSDGRRFRFDEFESLAASTAEYLRVEHGIGPGDRVAICAANSPGWLLLFWAATSMGAVVVAMNGWWTALEMGNALELTEPAVVFADAKCGERLPGQWVDIDAELDAMLARASTATFAGDAPAEDDPCILVFTSGTTGRPKAATLSHRNLIGFVMLQEYIGARGAFLRARSGATGPARRPPTRLAAFPLFHVSGLSNALPPLRIGSTTVWWLGRFDPAAVIDLTLAEGIDQWVGTQTHLLRLLQHPDVGRVPPEQINAAGIGGSATTPELVRQVDARFPHLAGTSASGYGATETGGVLSWTPGGLLQHAPDCVGPLLPTMEARITDDFGEPVPDGEVGDIWCRGPLVMQGYWNNEEANADVFAPGRWYRTGDYGRIEDGLLFIATRRRDLVIRGGENIYPFEIEHRLEEHPSVVEAAVIGVDDEVLGQEVKAFVVVAEGATVTADELREFCAVTLASYKVPAYLELRTRPLPRNPTGKILKNVLAGAEDRFVAED